MNWLHTSHQSFTIQICQFGLQHDELNPDTSSRNFSMEIFWRLPIGCVATLPIGFPLLIWVKIFMVLNLTRRSYLETSLFISVDKQSPQWLRIFFSNQLQLYFVEFIVKNRFFSFFIICH